MDNSDAENESRTISYDLASILKFLIPSFLGVLLFLTPIVINGAPTVLVAYLANSLRDFIGEYAKYVTTGVYVSAAIVSMVYMAIPARVAEKTPFLKHVFRTGPIWFSLTAIGGIASAMTFFGYGPEWIVGAQTGVTAYIDISIVIFCIVVIGCVLLPLLTDYGLLEFVGTLMRAPFKMLFGLPGRSAIDALTSWLGSSSIAVVLTARQYETGYYTAREASVIATNFSVVSVPFVIFVAQIAGIAEQFILLYATMVLIGVICAVVTPKLPPLSVVKNTYYEPVGRQISDDDGYDADRSALARGFNLALARAKNAPGPVSAATGGLKTAFDLAFAMMPAAMTIEFLVLIAYHHTKILSFLATPFVPVLVALGIPEAEAAAPGVFIGLLDQFVPAVIAGTIDNPKTSFVLAGLSVTQLIFFAETALLIVRSKIPLSILQLSMIFVLRTVIALPILAAAAHLFL